MQQVYATVANKVELCWTTCSPDKCWSATATKLACMPKQYCCFGSGHHLTQTIQGHSVSDNDDDDDDRR